MTEAEWLTSTIPRALLLALENRTQAGEIDRKLRLYACACPRRVWHLLVDERSREAVEVAELYAGGMASPERLDAAHDAANQAAWDRYGIGGLHAEDMVRIANAEIDRRPVEEDAKQLWHAASAAFAVTCRKVGIPGTDIVYESAWVAAYKASVSASAAMAGSAELRARDVAFRQASSPAAIESLRFYEEPWQCDLIRCIFGNPFRPVTLDPSWRTSTVVALAEGIYADRAFERLPILADALQDAGCGNEDVLAHCRSDGPHARGCWVVDLLLGKE